jgi:excisionase family DNA binding protein
LAPKTSSESRELRTMAQACQQLSCSRGTVEKLWREGKLERVRFLGQTRITARSLDALVDQMLANHAMTVQTEEEDDESPKKD